MELLHILTITLLTTQVITKSRNKHYDSSSSEDSIENLLYFKDCERKPKDKYVPPPVPLVATQPPPPPPTPKNECPFPKMCCALTCGNECGGKDPFSPHQMEPMHTMGRQGIEPFQAMMHPMQPNHNMQLPVQPQLRKRKKIKFPPPGMQMPINTRRYLGFTKEKIKSLINQDDDIRNILKDLVKVTMQKVNLVDPNEVQQNDGLYQPSSSTSTTAYEDYDEFID